MWRAVADGRLPRAFRSFLSTNHFGTLQALFWRLCSQTTTKDIPPGFDRDCVQSQNVSQHDRTWFDMFCEWLLWSGDTLVHLLLKLTFREEGGPPIFSISPRVIHHVLNLYTTSDAFAESILLSCNAGTVISARAPRSIWSDW